jgi:hemerythrin-like metal-binding protein
MELMTWQKEYELGIEEIDNQHKKIVEIINRLFPMSLELTDEEVLKVILTELTDYADYHFATEEKYFKLFNYPEAAGHIEVHNKYRNKIEEFKKEFAAAKTEEVFFNLNNFLKDWWIQHINHLDREYVPLFKEQGLK